MDHQFELKATWQGGLSGQGNVQCGNLATEISVPTELKGPGVGTNPEELLLGASAACYLITLSAILEKRQLKADGLWLRSSMTVSSEKGLRVTEITHRPRMRYNREVTEAERAEILQATQQAEKACLISSSLRGNVPVHIHPEFE